MLGIDMGVISRIEVLKGPGSALYGNNAFFGVVNIITHNPSNGPKIRINLDGESDGVQRGAIEASALSKKGLGIADISINLTAAKKAEIQLPSAMSQRAKKIIQ